MDSFIEIPPDRLEPDVLLAVIEEFITREGTDYGLEEVSLADKVREVKTQIASGKVLVVYDTESESCTLIPRDQA